MARLGDLVANILPEGQYSIVIDDVESKFSQAGNEMLHFTGTVTKGDMRNRKVFWNRTLTDKAIFRLAKDLIALGAAKDASIPDDPKGQVEALKQFGLALRRTQATVEVSVTEGRNGGRFNEVAFVASEGVEREAVGVGSGPARVSADDI